MTDRNHWQVCGLQEAAELAAIIAIITAMIMHPGSGGAPTTEMFTESAVRGVHVFTVLLVAVYVNMNFD